MANLDRAGCQFHDFAVPSEVISALALDLDRRITRRDLLVLSGEPGQQGLDGLPAWALVRRRGDLALDVVGVALLAPAHGEAIALAAVHDEGNRLGGFSQRDRQAAGGERVEGAGMSRTLGVDQAR